MAAALVLMTLVCGCQCAEDSGFWEFPAKTKSPLRHESDRLYFEYPSNWSIDTGDDDYHPDRHVIVESVAQCMVFIQLLDGEVDETVMADAMVDDLKILMPSPTVTSFSTYGLMEGEGRKMRGIMYFIAGELRVFAHNTPGATLVVYEQCFSEDLRKVRPGYDLIERTLTVVEPPGGDPE
jgi:hypothetical protein